MTSFDERENAFEAKFAHQEELRFKLREYALRLLALWAAERLGKTAEASEIYARNMVAIDVASPMREAALEWIATDLRATGISERKVRQAMDRFLAQAGAQIHASAS
ncbi:MAG TPA: ATPase inhibitor subunit zeta [Bradyrhizobium sp.]|uniref:ATPase inhibitor subunit zeta n=1 Tax=Bradyrhizobium sp. TaxID=376 RepID=UPI002B68635E|nr:ATPase inhibitor subunit zeta [Bradyrhizobium sp.]HLZ01189.1 ATPase inhibitor subunit zeta [Bradyrhizobium sp.]